MTKLTHTGIVGLLIFTTSLSAQDANVVVGVSVRPGPVDGTDQNSDEFIWRLFTQFTAPVLTSAPSPVVFETWASDADTFSTNPRWPDPSESKKFQSSVLGANTTPGHGPIDVPCKPPPGAAVGGFPTSGDPKVQCIAEETKRNRPQFDYIVENKLNTQAGLKNAYERSFNVAMPTTAISVKGDWVPVEGLLQWVPALGTVETIRKLYYTNTLGSVEYALVSLHVSSRQNPKWVWGSFEHHMNPGRCDYIGCFDSFGAETAVVPPNLSDYNSQYGACPKTDRLKSLMAEANLAPVWENYCMKATMVDFTAPDGTPYVLGNSVIEAITGNGTVAASSCITCHNYASFGSEGKPTAAATNILPYNPTGNPIRGVLDGSLQFDFMWGVLLAP